MTRFVGLLTCLLFATQAPATTLPYKGFEDLVREANGIVEGTVQEVTSRRVGRGEIYTYVTLSDLRIVKGRYERDQLTLLFEGGLVDGQGLHVHGSPTFREGERVIAFVEGNGQRAVPLVGWEQGLFRVVVNPETGERVISDSVGNRVFGVEDGRLVKESRVGTEAEILGQPGTGIAQSQPYGGTEVETFGRSGTGAAQSEPYGASPGRSEGDQTGLQPPMAPTGGGVPGRDIAEQARRGEAITEERFIQEIRQAVEQLAQQERAPEAEALTSVRVGAALERRDQPDAEPRQAQEPMEGLEQLAPEVRGQLPARIETGADRNLDLE